MLNLKIRMANALLKYSGQRNACEMMKAIENPKLYQHQTLKRILTTNNESIYGKKFSFDKIISSKDYQNTVPITDYDTLIPCIEQIKTGEPKILTSEPVIMFEKSSGSTAQSKYIPYTQNLLKEFQSATSVWLNNLLTHRPILRRLGAYWSVSPVAQQRELTSGGIPVGVEDDTEYFSFIERWVLQQIILVPGSVKLIPDITTWRYVTLRLLLNRPNLVGFISIWNPSFLTLLMAEVEAQGERLIYDLKNGTLNPPQLLPNLLHKKLSLGLRSVPEIAIRLQAILQNNQYIVGTDLWPNLQLISCWTSGNSRYFLPELQKRFPNVEIQGKGLLATEGIVSIPLLGHPGAVPALNSHYFEFIPENAEPTARTLGIHELEMNKRYYVLLTTGGGLYRYALHDLIEVIGYLKETPLLQFVGKAQKISDVVGEKLNELHVATILEELVQETKFALQFAMVAPELGTPPCYYLYLESATLNTEQIEDLTNRMETKLKANYHYAYARDLGQLGALKSQLITNGTAQYLSKCISLGQKAGDIKPSVLHTAFGWRHWFSAQRECA
jgi:hypothetical protein